MDYIAHLIYTQKYIAMSMWEIESLVEDSINLVDITDETNEEKIKLIGNLYAIQKQYDCSFTNFRVMPVLLKTGYTKTIDYTEHPDYKGNEAYFEALLGKDDIVYIYKDIQKKWSKRNYMVAYLETDTRLLYIDYGSPLRKKEPRLKVMNVYDLGLFLIRAAHRRQHKELIYDWTAFLLKFGYHFVDKSVTVEEVIEKRFVEIKEIWSGYDYTDYEPLRDSLTIDIHDEEELNDWIISLGGVRGGLLQWFLRDLV